jgi:hypothetical protein
MMVVYCGSLAIAASILMASGAVSGHKTAGPKGSENSFPILNPGSVDLRGRYE